MRRIVILGGGYAGLHAFSALQSSLRSAIARCEVEVTLVSRDVHHTYHGWTGEVLTGQLSVDSTLTALKPLLGESLVQGEVVSADLDHNTLTVKGPDGEQELGFDQLLLAAGSIDPFDRFEGLVEHGWCVKNVADMQKLVARLDSWEVRSGRANNVVVVGGGLAGVETASALAARFGRTGAAKVNIHLVSSSKELLPSLRPDFDRIAETATRTLSAQGIQLHLGGRVSRILDDHVELADGRTLSSDLTVVAAGVNFRALPGTEALPRNAAGQIIAENDLRVQGSANIWVAGDVGAISHPATGEPCPANALWAMKQGRCAGLNIARAIHGQSLKRFAFRGMGQAAGLSGQRGIAELYGVQLSGRLAWLVRILFFAWYMPSRRQGASIVWRLCVDLWMSIGGAQGARAPIHPATEAQVRAAKYQG